MRESDAAATSRADAKAAECARRRAALGIVIDDSTPIMFWPASDRRFLARIKRLAGDLLKERFVCRWDLDYPTRVGVELPLPCLKAALEEAMGSPASDMDVLVALLRQTFYLNMWCEKGYGRSRPSDIARYARKDACLDSAVELAGRIPGLSWGVAEDPDVESYSTVLYFDLPVGQVSFHTSGVDGAPTYAGTWNGIHLQLFPGDTELPQWYVEGRKRGEAMKKRYGPWYRRCC